MPLTAARRWPTCRACPANLLTYGYALARPDPAQLRRHRRWTRSTSPTHRTGRHRRQVPLQRQRPGRCAGSIDVAGASSASSPTSDGGDVSLAVTTPTQLLRCSTPDAAGTARRSRPTPATCSPPRPPTPSSAVSRSPRPAVTGPSAVRPDARPPARPSTLVDRRPGVGVRRLAERCGHRRHRQARLRTSVNATKGAGNVWTGDGPDRRSAPPAPRRSPWRPPDGTHAGTAPSPATVTPPVSIAAPHGATSPTRPRVRAERQPRSRRRASGRPTSRPSSPTKKGLDERQEEPTLDQGLRLAARRSPSTRARKAGKVKVTVDGKKTVIDLYSAKTAKPSRRTGSSPAR